MAKRSLRVLQLTRRRAAIRVRQLVDELRMLLVSFPDLRDAFDADELPVAFILERGARGSQRRSNPTAPGSASAPDSAKRRKKPNRAGHRKRPVND